MVRRASFCKSVGVLTSQCHSKFLMQVDEFMKDEAEVFVILASMKAERKVVIDELHVVCEFPEVFLDDINDFPPECKMEYVIDLVPGTSLVSMAPYRMSASELSELKKQLEELLEHKFV